MTSYYDPALKQARIKELQKHNGYMHVIGRIEDNDALLRAAEQAKPEIIVHLAAQVGVRYSLENPQAYVESNLVGSWRVCEVARLMKPRHLLLASTSSIYGANPKTPFAESDRADEQLSLYAATKKGMESMAHAYAHLHGVPTTSFRFFTVYGPWGRPDMAIFKFAKSIFEGKPIEIFGNGNMRRDFTYIDDLIEAIIRLMAITPQPGGGGATPFRVVNIGTERPVGLLEFIETLEHEIGKPAIRKLLPMQPGDVPQTYASATLLEELTGFRPQTPLALGVKAFVDWYRWYFKI